MFTVKAKRPINLALTTLTFPPMAIVSILHRMTGILLFLLMPFALYLLHLSLASPDSFVQLQTMFTCSLFKLSLWVFGGAMIYHVIAGIRHLLSDLGCGEHLPFARWTAYGVMALSAISILFLGTLIW